MDSMDSMDLEMISGSQRYWLALAETFEENQNVGSQRVLGKLLDTKGKCHSDPQCHQWQVTSLLGMARRRIIRLDAGVKPSFFDTF